MADTINVKGMDELARVFATLSVKLQKGILRKSLSTAARNAKAFAIARTPIGTRTVKRGSGLVTPPGTLRRAVIVKFDRSRSNDSQAVYLVTFRKGKKTQKGNRDAFYASWVEFGHRIVPRSRIKGLLKTSITSRRKSPTGKVDGRHMLRDSFAPNVAGHIQTIENEVRVGFDAAVAAP